MSTPQTTSVERDDGHEDGEEREAGRAFVYDVDGTTYSHSRPKIKGSEIMAAAGIPTSDGIVQLLADGTTKTIGPDDEVHLVRGAQFKRRPRFKRGSS